MTPRTITPVILISVTGVPVAVALRDRRGGSLAGERAVDSKLQRVVSPRVVDEIARDLQWRRACSPYPHELMADQSPEARREAEVSNVPVGFAQLARLKAPRGYWDKRLRQLSQSPPNPLGRGHASATIFVSPPWTGSSVLLDRLPTAPERGSHIVEVCFTEALKPAARWSPQRDGLHQPTPTPR
jgi:hypothetical protein